MLINNKSFGQDSFFLVSLTLLISLPFGFFWSSLTTGLWIAHAVFMYFQNLKFEQRSSLLFVWLIFCAYLCLSVFWANDSKMAFSALSNKVYLLLLPLAALFLPNISSITLRKILHYFSIFLSFTAIVLFFLALNRWYVYHYDAFLYYHELVSPLNLNAIYLSYMIAVVWLINFNIVKKHTVVFITYQIVLALFLVLLSSKNILLISILAIVIQSFVKLKSKRLRTILLLILVSASSVVILTKNPIKERYLTEFETSTEDIFSKIKFEEGRAFTGTEIRLLQMKAFYSSEKSLKDIILGVGVGNSQPKIKSFHKRLNTPDEYQDYNYHNQYLQILSETGVIGFVLFLCFFILLMKRLSRDITFLPFVLISMSLFLTESVLWRQRGIIFFSLILILMLKYEPDESQLSNR